MLFVLCAQHMGALVREQVPPYVDHRERSEVRRLYPMGVAADARARLCSKADARFSSGKLATRVDVVMLALIDGTHGRAKAKSALYVDFCIQLP